MKCVTKLKGGLKRLELVKVKSPSKAHRSKLPVVTPPADLHCHENQTAEGSHQFELQSLYCTAGFVFILPEWNLKLKAHVIINW